MGSDGGYFSNDNDDLNNSDDDLWDNPMDEEQKVSSSKKKPQNSDDDDDDFADFQHQNFEDVEQEFEVDDSYLTSLDYMYEENKRVNTQENEDEIRASIHLREKEFYGDEAPTPQGPPKDDMDDLFGHLPNTIETDDSSDKEQDRRKSLPKKQKQLLIKKIILK